MLRERHAVSHLKRPARCHVNSGRPVLAPAEGGRRGGCPEYTSSDIILQLQATSPCGYNIGQLLLIYFDQGESACSCGWSAHSWLYRAAAIHDISSSNVTIVRRASAKSVGNA